MGAASNCDSPGLEIIGFAAWSFQLAEELHARDA